MRNVPSEAITPREVQGEGQACSAAFYARRPREGSASASTISERVHGSCASALLFPLGPDHSSLHSDHDSHSSHMSALQFIVEGGQRLSGTIRPSGNKNAALPIVCAALITEHPVILENVPRIRDVETLVELIGTLVVDVK